MSHAAPSIAEEWVRYAAETHARDLDAAGLRHVHAALLGAIQHFSRSALTEPADSDPAPHTADLLLLSLTRPLDAAKNQVARAWRELFNKQHASAEDILTLFFPLAFAMRGLDPLRATAAFKAALDFANVKYKQASMFIGTGIAFSFVDQVMQALSLKWGVGAQAAEFSFNPTLRNGTMRADPHVIARHEGRVAAFYFFPVDSLSWKNAFNEGAEAPPAMPCDSFLHEALARAAFTELCFAPMDSPGAAAGGITHIAIYGRKKRACLKTLDQSDVRLWVDAARRLVGEAAPAFPSSVRGAFGVPLEAAAESLAVVELAPGASIDLEPGDGRLERLEAQVRAQERQLAQLRHQLGELRNLVRVAPPVVVRPADKLGSAMVAAGASETDDFWRRRRVIEFTPAEKEIADRARAADSRVIVSARGKLMWFDVARTEPRDK